MVAPRTTCLRIKWRPSGDTASGGYNPRERTVCEWWHIDTVASLSNIQTLAVAFEVAHGSNRLVPSAMTTPRANPPALAP